jgi:hypothetical protein
MGEEDLKKLNVLFREMEKQVKLRNYTGYLKLFFYSR